MIRAMILQLLGAVFEVRLVSLKTGKDYPGTRICRGSYWKCRKVYQKKQFKNHQELRLQAVIRIKALRVDVDIPEKVQEMKDKIRETKWTDSDLADVNATQREDRAEYAGMNFGETHSEWLRRTSDMLRAGLEPHLHPDLGKNVYNPDYQGEDLDDHKCDTSGPLDWDTDNDIYASTCSICGTFYKRSLADE